MTGLDRFCRRDVLYSAVFMCAAICLLVGSGCCTTVTVKKWKGPVEQVDRINVRPTHRSQPWIAEHAWEEFPFGVSVKLECRQAEQFDQLRVRRNFKVTRSSGRWGKYDMSVGAFIALPFRIVFLPLTFLANPGETAKDIVGHGQLPERTDRAKDAQVIEWLVGGWKRGRRSDGISSRHVGRSMYKLHVTSKQVDPLLGQTGDRIVPAEGVLVRWCDGDTLVKGVTDAKGRCYLSLADSREMLAEMAPGSNSIEAYWADKWMQVGQVRLTQVTLDKALAAADRDLNRATELPEPTSVDAFASRKPLVAILAPVAGATVTQARTTVEGLVADEQGLSSVTFELNGQPVGPVMGDKAIGVAGPENDTASSAQGEIRFAVDMRLTPGLNEIKVTAVNTLGESETKLCSVMFEQNAGQVHVVSIGIDAYEHVRPCLRFAAADALAVAACLRQRLGVPDKNVTLLVNEQATRRNMLRELGDRLRAKASRGDTVIIFFSGHGAPEADPRSPDRDGIEKYLLPVDAEKDALFATAVRMEEIRQIFQRIDSDRVIFLADSCYSGQAGGRSITPDRQYRNIDQGSLLKRLQQTGKGRVIITASAADEVSQEDPQYGHGVFTYHLLRGLQGAADANSDGEVTVFELFTYVNREVPRATSNRQHPKAKMEDTDGAIVLSFIEKAK